MELGLALPTAGPQASPETIVRVAREAERLGYAALWTFERLLRPLEKVVLWTGGEPAVLPEFYGFTYEPLETLSSSPRCGPRGDRTRSATTVSSTGSRRRR
ncbi:hypothetical protein JCM33774_17300 [Actinophytocola sp. KF-1]